MNADLLGTMVVLAISLTANIVLGSIVLFQNPKKYLNRIFFAVTLAAGLWVVTNLLFVVFDGTPQYIAALVSYGAAASLAMFFLLYCLALRHVPHHSKKIVAINIVGILIIVLSMQPGLIASGVTDDSQLITNPLPLIVYGLYLVGYFLSGLIVLLWTRHKTVNAERAKITIVLVGLGLAGLMAIFLNLVLPILGNYNFVKFGPVSTLLVIGSSTYAIIRHGLFDIKLAAVRSIVYICALATLSAVYYLLAYLLSQLLLGQHTTNAVSVSPINILLALFLAFLFQPVERFFNHVTDKLFYRDVYDTEAFFADLSELLASTTDLRGILQRASEEIAMTLKAEQCFFFLHYTSTVDHHLSSGTKNHARLPLFDAKMLGAYAMSHDDQIIRTDSLPEESDVRRMLVSHQITLVMPLRHSRRVIGYVCLGEQQGSGYVKRDLRVLTTISNELVIAIQNALSVHEVREINATLQQRIHVATAELRESNAQLHRLDVVKDEFVSMASHQLRTPLTSVKGYISMMLDGDVGKITDMQRHALEEAFNSSERMVRLIGDFLSVSRLQTGKFIIDRKPVDLVKVVGQEVEGLRMIASTHGQKLTYVHPKQLQLINLDESKIRQVIMNFIDNAIYYSRTGTTIHVAVGQINDEVVFTVEDAGIGVPKDQQPKLFSKFYRATNARQQRPDGTGVGLYLAKKVIVEHGGKVIFSSVENQGSTFGFRMPLNQQANEPDNHNNESK